MGGPESNDDFDVPAWLLSLTRALGASDVRVRWKVLRWHKKWVWLRRELVPPSRRFEHQICPSCNAVQDRLAARCAACGERMGSGFTKALRALGLSIPTALSVSSLLGIAMIAIYARMISARPGQGIMTWDVETLVTFGANWLPAIRAGQWWRFATAIFLHIGLWHIAFNLLALSQIGPSIEEIFGRARMVFLFMATGVVANVASAYAGHGAVSAGASGALMGLIGVAAGWGHRTGTSVGRDVRNQMLKWGGYTMLFGVFIGADNIAHGVGFVAGAISGLAFRPEMLRHTKVSAVSAVMGLVGGLAALATTAVALRPPASSYAIAAELARTDAPTDDSPNADAHGEE